MISLPLRWSLAFGTASARADAKDMKMVMKRILQEFKDDLRGFCPVIGFIYLLHLTLASYVALVVIKFIKVKRGCRPGNQSPFRLLTSHIALV